ncbi:MAG TPA: 2-oxoacid:acceptor oxidoreductase subunit alpha, partial [Leptolinea sp.]
KRLAKKYVTAEKFVPKPVIQTESSAAFGIMAFGSSDPAIIEARDQFRKAGFQSNYCRVRAIPFTPEVQKFIEDNAQIFVVEMNRDGQMCQLLQITYPQYANKFIKICHMDGLPLTAKWIRESIQTVKEVLP